MLHDQVIIRSTEVGTGESYRNITIRRISRDKEVTTRVTKDISEIS